MKRISIPVSIAAVLLFAKACFAGEVTVTNATVVEPLVATARTASATFVISNQSQSDDSLMAISTPIADHAAIHQSTEDNGVMHMAEIPVLNVARNSEFDLAAQHMHVMLSGLHGPLQKGDSVEFVVTFAHAGSMTVDAVVVARP